jgi:hypothetical protein
MARPQDDAEWSKIREAVYRGARVHGAPHEVGEDIAQAAVERWLRAGNDAAAVARLGWSRGAFDAKSWRRSTAVRTLMPITDQHPMALDVAATVFLREQLRELTTEAAEFSARFERADAIVQLAVARKLRDCWRDAQIAAEQGRLRGRAISRTGVVHQRRRLLKDLPALAALAGDREREGT